MKKKSRLKSFFAILLAVSMVFQQSSLTVLATDDTYAEDVTATPTPSESEAEEYTEEEAEPVAEEPEEPVAEEPEEPQEEPETPAEEPVQEPTEAPTEQPTEAPAEQPTEAPAAAPTETPAAEVTEAPAAPEATETPAAEVTATPTPEVSAVPSETPTPTPTEAPKTSFRYEDSRVVITATAPEDANLPQNAEIKADYIAPGTDRYNAAVAAFNSQLSSQLGLNAKNTTAEYVLYDVYFLTADGKRIEPESGNVKVDMSFKQIQESTVDGDVVNKDVVHLDNEGQAEVVTEYINTNADGEITSMGFTQDSFSIVGGVTTYENTSAGENENNVTYQETTNLSELLNGITLTVDSKKTVIEKDTKVTLRNNEEISLSLSFLEQEEAGGYQFSTSKTLEYTLPDGFTFPQKITDQEFSIIVDKKDSTGTHRVTIPGNKYSVVGNKLYVTLADNADLKSVANASFDLNLKAKVTTVTNGKKIDFGGNKSMEVVLDNKSHVSVEKQIMKYDDDGTAHYKIVVKSVGENTNVIVTDRFSSDVLEYKKNVTAKRNGTDINEVQENGNKLSYNEKDGFTSVIAKMNDGDEITYEYTAKVDYSKVKDGTVSSDKKKNTVTVVPNGDDTEKKEDSAEYAHEIKYNWISKTNGSENSAGNSMSWTLTVNGEQKQSAAGMVVKDTIDEASRKYLSYDENTVIICKVYKPDGSEVRTDRLPITSLELERDASGKIIGWKYIIPVADTDAYKYVFSYNTTLEKGNLVNDVTVKNNATVDGKYSDSGSTKITGVEVGGNKEVVSISPNKETTTWKITVDLPAEGLDSLVVTDTLPKSGWFTDTKGNYGQKIDTFNKIVSITSGYENKYKLEYDSSKDPSKFVLTFYKDVAKTIPGVEAGDDNRKIEITFETSNDTEWVNKAGNDSGYVGHTNTADIKANDVSISKSATANITPVKKKNISKARYEAQGNYWYYEIVLEGVNADNNNITVTDVLDQYMTYNDTGWVKPRLEGYSVKNFYYGGGVDLGAPKVGKSSDGKTLTFDCSDLKLKNSDDHYYMYYVLFYAVNVD